MYIFYFFLLVSNSLEIKDYSSELKQLVMIMPFFYFYFFSLSFFFLSSFNLSSYSYNCISSRSMFCYNAFRSCFILIFIEFAFWRNDVSYEGAWSYDIIVSSSPLVLWSRLSRLGFLLKVMLVESTCWSCKVMFTAAGSLVLWVKPMDIDSGWMLVSIKLCWFSEGFSRCLWICRLSYLYSCAWMFFTVVILDMFTLLAARPSYWESAP